jgi:hypothetical protein
VSTPTAVVSLETTIPDSTDAIIGTDSIGGAKTIGDGLTTISSSVVRCTIRRGRWGQLYDDFEAASINVVVNNETRAFDPSYASGTYYGNLDPGRRLKVEAGGVTIVSGFVQDYDLEYDVSGRSVVALKATDGLGQMAALSFDEWTNSADQASVKLDAICNRPEVNWPAELRDFVDALGATSLQADLVSWGSNVLNYMQLIARSDKLSYLFVSAGGVLTLRERRATSSVASFGGANIPYQTVQVGYGTETLFSEVSVDRAGGTAQTYTDPGLTAWVAKYKTQRRLSIPSTLLSSDALALALASDLQQIYSTPTFRFTEFSVQLAALGTSDQATVLGIDIAQRVTIEFTPNNVGSAISQTLVVQGIAHEITPESHVVTFSVIAYGSEYIL